MIYATDNQRQKKESDRKPAGYKSKCMISEEQN
jgi:hypothetical protein